MQKYYYPMEEQLERIAEETEFELRKPIDLMNEAEFDDAVEEAARYVEWVEDKEYIQYVPKRKSDGVIIYP